MVAATMLCGPSDSVVVLLTQLHICAKSRFAVAYLLHWIHTTQEAIMQKTLHNKIALGRRYFTASDDVREVVRMCAGVAGAFLMAVLLGAATL
jgi:hypothetical protein